MTLLNKKSNKNQIVLVEDLKIVEEMVQKVIIVMRSLMLKLNDKTNNSHLRK